MWRRRCFYCAIMVRQMSFQNELKSRTEKAEETVRQYLPGTTLHQHTVTEAMEYSVMAGGKRLRPVMMQAAFEMCGGKSGIEPFMAAIEMIHSYSLVHDDLPEMDNDELRRGKPTTHIQYGQAMAVLAGDGLLNYAYETVLAHAKEAEDKEAYIKAMALLANKAGIFGMVGGQCLDVEAEKKGMELSEEQLLFVYENKTAALLQASLMCGALLAGDDAVAAVFEKAGYDLGIAFQLQDDILDIESTTQELGKPVGSDERNGKKTYVSYLGMEKAKKEQERLSAEAVAMIEKIQVSGDEQGSAKQFLMELISSLCNRRK